MHGLALIYLGATGALVSDITNSSALVAIVNSLDQNPSYLVLIFLSNAAGSWMKAVKAITIPCLHLALLWIPRDARVCQTEVLASFMIGKRAVQCLLPGVPPARPVPEPSA